MKQLELLIFSTIFLVSVSIIPTHVQPEQLDPVITTEMEIFNLSWSADSQRFAFVDRPEVKLDVPGGWREFDLATRSLTTGDIWPFQPTLTPTEEHIFMPIVSSDGQRKSFLYESPNGRYLVYGGFPLPDVENNLMVADRINSQFARTSDIALDTLYGPGSFHVIWSADSTTFLVEIGSGTIDNAGVLITNFTDDINLATFTSTQFLLIGSKDFALLDAYDLSASSAQVLQLMDELDSAIPGGRQAPFPERLVVYEVNDPTSSQIITAFTDINGASFAPDDETKVLAVTEQGLVEYDLTTDAFVVLNAEVNTSWVDEALFSPDGRAVALRAFDENGPDHLFIELVSDLSGHGAPTTHNGTD